MPEELTPEEVNAKLENGDDVQVVDIRTPDAYAEGHIPGARNVPLDQFAARVEDVEWGDDIVLACYVGETSVQAGRLLESYEGVPEGARVASMAGGYQAWGYDLETEEE